MKNYHLRKGIVLVELCGEFLLVATQEARKYCKYYYPINETAAYYWKLMEQEPDLDKVIATASAEYEVSEEEIRPGFVAFLDSLEKEGYLIWDAE